MRAFRADCSTDLDEFDIGRVSSFFSDGRHYRQIIKRLRLAGKLFVERGRKEVGGRVEKGAGTFDLATLYVFPESIWQSATSDSDTTYQQINNLLFLLCRFV